MRAEDASLADLATNDNVVDILSCTVRAHASAGACAVCADTACSTTSLHRSTHFHRSIYPIRSDRCDPYLNAWHLLFSHSARYTLMVIFPVRSYRCLCKIGF